MISETKFDETSPKGQFLMDGFTPPYRMDRNIKKIYHPDKSRLKTMIKI